MFDGARPTVVEGQFVAPPDLRLPCPPHVWDEEGADDHRERQHGPIDRPLPERRRQPPRLGVDDRRSRIGE